MALLGEPPVCAYDSSPVIRRHGSAKRIEVLPVSFYQSPLEEDLQPELRAPISVGVRDYAELGVRQVRRHRVRPRLLVEQIEYFEPKIGLDSFPHRDALCHGDICT